MTRPAIADFVEENDPEERFDKMWQLASEDYNPDQNIILAASGKIGKNKVSNRKFPLRPQILTKKLDLEPTVPIKPP